jgi:hypothetical protein
MVKQTGDRLAYGVTLGKTDIERDEWTDSESDRHVDTHRWMNEQMDYIYTERWRDIYTCKQRERQF